MTTERNNRSVRSRCIWASLAVLVFLAIAGTAAIVVTALKPRCATGIDEIQIDEADTFDLPDFSSLSKAEINLLLDGEYRLPRGYFLQSVIYSTDRYKLCVLSNPFEVSTACLQVGRVNESIPCNPGMRADCMSGAVIDSYFGLTVWDQDKASVTYVIAGISPSFNRGIVTSQTITNTSIPLSQLWYKAMDCQVVFVVDIAAIVFIVFTMISFSTVCAGCQCWLRSKRLVLWYNSMYCECIVGWITMTSSV